MSERGRATFERALRDSLPERWPAVRALLVDDADQVWMALSGKPGAAAEWAVFSPTGEYLGSTLLPEGFKPWVIRGRTIYGEQSDELGVPRVAVRNLDRPL